MSASMRLKCRVCFFFFFNDTATTEIYTLSLHDALPILSGRLDGLHDERQRLLIRAQVGGKADRKSTRLNSSHSQISYAVFCLKKKKQLHPYRRSLPRLSCVSRVCDPRTTRRPPRRRTPR